MTDSNCRWVAIATGVLLGAAAMPAHAQRFAEATDWLPTGTYVGLNIGTASSSASAGTLSARLTQADTINSIRVDESGMPWRLFVGKQVHNNIALELGFAELGTIDVDLDADVASANTAAFLTQLAVATPVAPVGVTFDVVGRWEVAAVPGLHLLARAGLFAWRSEVSFRDGTSIFRHEDDGLDSHLGLGLGWSFNDRLDARLEFERYYATTRMNTTTLGVVYRF